jgi:hypothetical protein
MRADPVRRSPPRSWGRVTVRSATAIDRPADSRRLASLIGPMLLAITMSEVVNLGFLVKQYPNYSYMNGTIVFAAGLAIVRAHNRWTWRWPVVVTLTGWVAIVWGLARMFAPEVNQGGASVPTYVGIAIPFAVGVLLTFQAYRPAHREADAPVVSRRGR